MSSMSHPTAALTRPTAFLRAVLFPSVLLLAASQVGCGSSLGKNVELDATRAALDAQMQETARVERALMEAEAGQRLPEQNEHAPPTDVKVPPQIPVDDPTAVAETEPEPPAEPFEPVEEEVPEPPPAEEIAVATAAEVVAEQEEEDPWVSLRSGLGGAPGSVDTWLLKESIDRVARAIEQQTMLELVEARLEDKQRLMDGIRTDLDRRTLGITDESAASPSASGQASLDPRIATQLEALAASQSALGAQLQAMQEAKVAEEAAQEAKAAQDAQAAEAAAKEAAAKKAQAEKDAAEQARWDALMGRLTTSATTAPATDSAAKTTTGAAVPADDPRVAALEAQLKEIQDARAAEQQKARDEAEAQKGRHLEERERALAEMEARYAALSAQQKAALDEIEQERKEQRRAWQFWRKKDDTPAAAPTQDPAVVQAQIDAMKAATRAEWDDLLARQEEEKAALDAERDAAAADRAALEARLAELTARMEQASSTPSVDPAELARMEELAASVETLRARTGELEAATIAKQQRMQARLQPIVDAGLQVSIKDDRARILLPSDVLFTSGKSTLAAGGLSTVDTVGSTLAKASGLRVQVEGHTDNVPIAGSARTNWDLGFARAKAVLDRLIDKGVPADRISAASYGDTRPVASNDTADGRKLNRRIEIVVLLTD